MKKIISCDLKERRCLPTKKSIKILNQLKYSFSNILKAFTIVTEFHGALNFITPNEAGQQAL